MDRISTILKKYISERIPRKVTNIFWQLFNGCEAMFTNIEYRLDINKRERNILTAQNLSSLRNLAAQNGFTPSLKIAAKGLLKLNFSSTLFNRVGYPLFLPTYAEFTNSTTGLTYYYDSNKSLKINSSVVYIPVIEGTLKTVSENITESNTINRIYLEDDNIVDGSILIMVNDVEFTEVKSFFDNDGLNDNKQFLYQFGVNSESPIILYVKGLSYGDVVSITYRLCNGEAGNIENEVNNFETESLLDSIGSNIETDDDELVITNNSGFDYGSNGSDENMLRSAIGYNHTENVLFDDLTYKAFLSKFSTILLQKIVVDSTLVSIKNLYVMKKPQIDITSSNLISVYNSIITNTSYLLTKTQKDDLSAIIKENQFALMSHNIYDCETCKFALQITFASQDDVDNYSDSLNTIIYQEFAKFMYIKSQTINFDVLFKNFMDDNSITFEFTVFNEKTESLKIKNKSDYDTSKILKHEDYLPILCGDFLIAKSDYSSIKLFFNINSVAE